MIPEGTPADERLALVITSASGELWSPAQRRHELGPARRGELPFEVAVEGDGTWELDARYLQRLDGLVDEATLADELVLEPQLGGIVRGRVTSRGPVPGLYMAALGTGDLVSATQARVDEAGRFELRAVAPAAGLELAVYELAGTAERRSRSRGASGIAVRARRGGVEVRAGRVTEVELAREPGALVAGRVLDLERSPVEGALVTVGVEERRGQSPLALLLMLETDAEGRFRGEDLPAGELHLAASYEERAHTALDLPPLAPGEQRDALELTLDLGATLRGRVIQPDGRPALQARVALVQEDGPEGAGCSLKARTDWEGRFERLEVAPGRWFVVAELGARRSIAEPVSLQSGEEPPELTLRLCGTGELTVDVRRRDGSAGARLPVELAGPDRRRSLTTDGAGRATFRELPGGTYEVTVSDAAGEVLGRMRVELSEGGGGGCLITVP